MQHIAYLWVATDLSEFHLFLSWSSIPARMSLSGSSFVQRSLRLRPSLMVAEYSPCFTVISSYSVTFTITLKSRGTTHRTHWHNRGGVIHKAQQKAFLAPHKTSPCIFGISCHCLYSVNWTLFNMHFSQTWSLILFLVDAVGMAPSGCFTCTHQMAALIIVKWRHVHLESVMSNQKSESVNRCIFTWRISPSECLWTNMTLTNSCRGVLLEILMWWLSGWQCMENMS